MGGGAIDFWNLLIHTFSYQTLFMLYFFSFLLIAFLRNLYSTDLVVKRTQFYPRALRWLRALLKLGYYWRASLIRGFTVCKSALMRIIDSISAPSEISFCGSTIVFFVQTLLIDFHLTCWFMICEFKRIFIAQISFPWCA